MTPELTSSATITFSNSDKIMFAKTGPNEEPVETPSNCS